MSDQWDGEGVDLLKPWSEGTLSFGDLLAPHNEHRIFFSRLLTLTLTYFNRQWDSMPVLVFDAILCGLLAAAFLAVLLRLLNNRFPILLTITITLWLALPYGQQNTLWAFQSSFYFLLSFSLLALWGLLLHRPFSRGWFVGALGALFAPLTVGSGFFAAAVVGLILLVDLIRRERTARDAMPTVILATAVVILSCYFQVTVPAHAALKATSFVAWLAFLGRCLAWPLSDNPALAVVAYAPLILLGVSQFICLRWMQRPTTVVSRAVVGAGLWVGLEAAAMAYARGGIGDAAIPWRYLDILGLGVVMNIVAICLLVPRPSKKVSVLVTNAAACAWLIAMLATATIASRDQIRGQFGRKAYTRSVEQAVRAYLATKDRRVLEGEVTVPYPNVAAFAAILDDPTIQKLLPASARLPLHIEKSATSDNTFTKPGCPPEAQTSPENTWGSYSPGGETARGSMVTEMFQTRFSYLELDVAGDLDGARSLTVHDIHGASLFRWLEHDDHRESSRDWRKAYALVSASEVRLEARDQSPAGWLAFSEPREMGALSYYSVPIVESGKALCFCGIGLLIVSAAQAVIVAFKGTFVRSRIA